MVLRIPEGGLELESSPKAMAALPLQAFALTLSDDLLEDMIECVQNGKDIELSLGNTPCFLYGSEVHHIPRTSSEAVPYDLYVTDPKSTETASLLPNPTMPLFRNPNLNKMRWLPQYMPRASSVETEGSTLEVEHPGSRPNTSISKGLLPQGTAKKPKPTGKKSIVSNKGSSFSMSVGNSARSHPSSPALSGIGSPLESSIETATQQVVEKAKEARVPIIHALAVREMTYDELWAKWGGSEETRKDFRNILDKVADQNKTTTKYSMKKMFWKELDVWNHGYDSDSDRQLAIDNAVRRYDQMRIGASGPEWQRLLPLDERDKGKCLSKLQAAIAKGPKAMAPKETTAPKIQVQKADDSSGGDSGPRDDDARSLTGSEPMSRSNSQQARTAKKAADLPVSKKPAATTTKKAATPKAAPAKTAPKAGAKTASATGGRGPLSKEIISDSDTSSEEIPLSQTKQARKVLPVTTKSVRPPAAVSAPKPRPVGPQSHEPIKPQITARPMKRSREDDDSSSSSGTPLSKKFKTKEPLRTTVPAVKDVVVKKDVTSKERPATKDLVPRDARPSKEVRPVPSKLKSQRGTASDGSNHNSRSTGSSSSSLNGSAGHAKAKPNNTSPVKSSPLASSPPTNASDIDPAEEAFIASANAAGAVLAQKKRKAAELRDRDRDRDQRDRDGGDRDRGTDSDGLIRPPAKKTKTVDMARRFKTFYARYENLHHELSAMASPPEERLIDLVHMRERLLEMKKEIYEAAERDRDHRERARKFV